MRSSCRLSSLRSVCALQQAVRVLVQWTVEEEKNLSFYFLHGSIDGVGYKQLAAVQPNTGNAPGAYKYTYRANEGITYFHLKMDDKDGKFDYSPVKVISTQPAADGLSILGNPARTNTTLLINTSSVPFVKLSLHDITGGALLMLERLPTNTLFSLNDLNRYKSGI